MTKALIGLLFLLLTSVIWAQTYDTGNVLKWESKPYSQSAHIIRNHIVYSVQVGHSILQIARRSVKTEMTVGQQIKCRLDRGHIFVLNEKGKETEFDIIGSEPTADAPEAK